MGEDLLGSKRGGKTMQKQTANLSDEQLSLIERNLEMTVDERIDQLQSAVDLIEEMRNSIKEKNENRLKDPTR